MFGELTLYLAIALLFGVAVIFIILVNLRMPPAFADRQKLRSDLKKRIIRAKVAQQELLRAVAEEHSSAA